MRLTKLKSKKFSRGKPQKSFSEVLSRIKCQKYYLDLSGTLTDQLIQATSSRPQKEDETFKVIKLATQISPGNQSKK